MARLITIARIRSMFPEKFGIPRQSNLVKDLKASVVFEPGFQNPDMLRGLETFSHIWLLWGFSQTERETWSPTVRPPRLGGNTRMGVFATRSPYRPNAIGLSSVEIDRIDRNPAAPMIHILGADIMDGTPVYDIKPYLPFTDSHPQARGGYPDALSPKSLRVSIGKKLLERIPEEERDTLLALLSGDPRPSYQHDPNRVYGMAFGRYNVKFNVEDDVLTVRGIGLIDTD